MDDIRHGLMSGDDLVKEYSTNHAKTNVYFVLDDLAGTLKVCVRLDST